MASAARMHAVEWGQDVRGRVLIAFGGAAPLHAARLAQKLDISRVIIPKGAGVGSAIGFLRAPVAYEVVRSRYAKLSDLNVADLQTMFADMREEASVLVRSGAPDAPLTEQRLAYMRYFGQGHEIPVAVESGTTHLQLKSAFEAAYTQLFGRTIPDLEVEILSWTLSLAAPETPIQFAVNAADSGSGANQEGERDFFDQALGEFVRARTVAREALTDGKQVAGPALIEEAQTTTVVPTGFSASLTPHGHLSLTATPADGASR